MMCEAWAGTGCGLAWIQKCKVANKLPLQFGMDADGRSRWGGRGAMRV